VEGFVITTLDAAVRLNRYLFEELWGILFKTTPKLLKHYWFNSGLSVALMWMLAYTNAFNMLWPIFGTANQMLAALSLLAVTGWLLLRKRKTAFTLVPAVFMLATTLASLGILLREYIQRKSYILVAADILMFILAIGVVLLVVGRFWRKATPRPSPAS